VAAALAVAVSACGDDDDQGSGPSGSDRGRDAGAEGEAPASRSPEESIRTYGTEADDDTEAAIETAVTDFYAAKAAGDGAGTCAQLAREARKTLVQTLGRSGELKGKGCSAIVSHLLEDLHPQYLDRIERVEVTGARVKDDRGLALIEIEATPEEVIPVRREGSSWKVAAFVGSDIP
jgi:hypothetical protein